MKKSFFTPKLKDRKCKACGNTFRQERAGQYVCSPVCGMNHARFQREKAEMKKAQAQRKVDRERKEKLKSRADWMREAQAAVNRFCRLRDQSKGYRCISCDRDHQGAIHAGHYLSRGAHPELALEEKNIHLQCAPCNVHLSGNQAKTRIGLVARYGEEFVLWLEGPHEPKKYTIEDLKNIKDKYRRKAKELEKS